MILQISFPYIFEMMITGKKLKPVECVEGIPEDAVFISAHTNNKTEMVEFLFTHPKFPVTFLGEEITKKYIILRDIEGEFVPNKKNP